MATGGVLSQPTPQLQGQGQSQDRSPFPSGAGHQSPNPDASSTGNDNTGDVANIKLIYDTMPYSDVNVRSKAEE